MAAAAVDAAAAAIAAVVAVAAAAAAAVALQPASVVVAAAEHVSVASYSTYKIAVSKSRIRHKSGKTHLCMLHAFQLLLQWQRWEIRYLLHQIFYKCIIWVL